MQEDQVLKKIMDEWKCVSQDPEVLLAYEARKKALLDEKSALKRAEKLAEEKGKQIGEEIGEKKGIIKVALSMIQKGLDTQTIVEFTNLTPEEIDKLRHQ